MLETLDLKDLRKWGGDILFLCLFHLHLTYLFVGVNLSTFSRCYSFHGIGYVLLRREVHCQ